MTETKRFSWTDLVSTLVIGLIIGGLFGFLLGGVYEAKTADSVPENLKPVPAMTTQASCKEDPNLALFSKVVQNYTDEVRMKAYAFEQVEECMYMDTLHSKTMTVQDYQCLSKVLVQAAVQVNKVRGMK